MIQGLCTGTLNENDQYLYAVGRIRVLEASLLRRSHLERAIEVGTAGRVWDIFREASRWWADHLSPESVDAETLLEARLAESIREVGFMAPFSPIAPAFAIRWDFLRLKDKVRRAGLDGGADAVWVEKITEEGGFLLQEDTLLDYREALVRVAEQLAREPAPQTVDRVLDGEMYRIIFRRLSEAPIPFARQYFSRRVDLLNLSLALRGKLRGAARQEIQAWWVPEGALPEAPFLEAWGGALHSFAGPFEGTVLDGLIDGLLQEGDETEIGHRLEREMDDHLTEFVHAGKYVTFGPEPLVGYLHGIEMEVKNVRRVINGLAGGEGRKDILAEVRNLYV
jgi:V/A-type H+-transporting ATPase subunit C